MSRYTLLLLGTFALLLPLSTQSAAQSADACNDGIDNDHDGLIDYPADPGCAWIWDGDWSERAYILVDGELEPDPALPCDNGHNDDCAPGMDYVLPGFPGGDGGCQMIEGGAFDVSERSPYKPCDDGKDNDGDGDDRIDYRMCRHDGGNVFSIVGDNGCSSDDDWSEKPECEDRWDNDGDGTADYHPYWWAQGWVDGMLGDPECSGVNKRDRQCHVGNEWCCKRSVMGGEDFDVPTCAEQKPGGGGTSGGGGGCAMRAIQYGDYILYASVPLLWSCRRRKGRRA
jgi:hypothetical protein